MDGWSECNSDRPSTSATQISSERYNGVHRPLMCDNSHLFGGASSGASWFIDGILCIINSTLRGEFGGYTAHHLPRPKTSGSIQHDVKSRENPPENQGLIVQRRPEALIDSHRLQGSFLVGGRTRSHARRPLFLPCVRREQPQYSQAMKRHPELRTIRLRDINSSFHIRNNIWGRFGWRQWGSTASCHQKYRRK